MANAPSTALFESQIHNRFRDSVYKEQGKRGLGPYSEGQTPLARAVNGLHDGTYGRQQRGGGSATHGATGGAELKRTRNLFEERVRFYLGRGASRKGNLGGLSQGGLANVRRRMTSGVTPRACADCKKITVSLTGASLTILVCTMVICAVGSVWGITSTRRTVLCMGTSLLLMGPLVTAFHFVRKYLITPRLKWNEQHTLGSDVKICGVLLLLATLAGSFTSIYGRHLYNLSGYTVFPVNSTAQLPNSSAFGDSLSSTVFAFDLSRSTIRNSAAKCTAVALDEERYNETSWTAFPYMSDCTGEPTCGSFSPLAPDLPGNVSYWLTYSTKVDSWFVSDFVTSLPASGDGVVYGIKYQYSEHDVQVLLNAVGGAEVGCNIKRSEDPQVLTLVNSVEELMRDWRTAVVLLHLACSILVPALVYGVYMVLKKCCSTTTVVILKD